MRSLLFYLAQFAGVAYLESLSDRRRYDGKHLVMFWSNTHRPQDYVGATARVAPGDVLTALAVLRSGEVLERYMGWAECRICGAHLGTKDMTAFDFVWPEKAEHYIEVHGVWAPGMSDMVSVAKSFAPRPTAPL